MWQQETIPQDFKDASIIHLCKRKGNRQSCENHRGISLLSITGKILLNRLTLHLDQGLLPESQCGFRKEHRTIDMVLAARQLKKNVMSKYGCPRKFIAMVKQFHDGMQARVQDNDETSEPFPVPNGVKLGCVLTPSLFSFMFTAMSTDAFRDGDIGISIRC